LQALCNNHVARIWVNYGKAGGPLAAGLGAGVPTIYQGREFAAAGGVMRLRRRCYRLLPSGGVHAGRIPKGAKPADLPFRQSTKPEQIINLKAAKELDLTIPISLLGRADEVID
jgi:putative ABC transport system substrate-binding protein